MRMLIAGSILLAATTGAAHAQEARAPEPTLALANITLGQENKPGIFDFCQVSYALTRPSPAPGQSITMTLFVNVGPVRSAEEAEIKGRQELKAIADDLKRLADKPAR